MWPELIYAGIIAADYVYHRWFNDQPPKPNPGRSIQLPTAQDGASIPVLYGRARVRAPILAWWGSPDVFSGITFGGPDVLVYGVDMFFNVATGFLLGGAQIHNVFAGELQLDQGPPGLESLSGDGGFGTPVQVDNSGSSVSDGYVGGFVEFLNGNANAQTMVDTGHAATTYAALHMIAAGQP